MTRQEPEAFPYASAQAFGAAITGRLKNLAAASGGSASLKGGVSMIVRLTSARHTADIDLVAAADSADAALKALRAAAAQDLGDFFGFRFEPPRALVQGVPGLRIPTEAWLGPRLFERFGVDLVTGVVITGLPEEAEPLLPLAIPGFVRPRYLLYPLVDSIADKVMAIVETHQGRPSTRFRDLVDLVLMARRQALVTMRCADPAWSASTPANAPCATRRGRSSRRSSRRAARRTADRPGPYRRGRGGTGATPLAQGALGRCITSPQSSPPMGRPPARTFRAGAAVFRDDYGVVSP